MAGPQQGTAQIDFTQPPPTQIDFTKPPPTAAEPELDQFAKDRATTEAWAHNHKILGPIARFLVAGGQNAASAITDTPSFLYHAITDPPTTEEVGLSPEQRVIARLGIEQGIKAGQSYAGGEVTPKGALSVLPEALGTGVGQVAGGAVYGKGAEIPGEVLSGMRTAAKVAASKASSAYDALPADLQKEVKGIAGPRLTSAIRLWNGLKELRDSRAAAAVDPSLTSPSRTLPGMNAPEVTGRPTPGPIQGPGRGLMLTGDVPASGKLSDLVAAPSAERIPAVRDPSTILPRLRAIAQQIEEEEAKAKAPLDLTAEVQDSINKVIDNKVLSVLGKEGKGSQISLETLQKSPVLNRFTPEQLRESAVRLGYAASLK